MHGIRYDENIRRKQKREQEIIDRIIATAGGVVTFGIFVSIPFLPAIIVGKLAWNRAKEMNRDWFFDPYNYDGERGIGI